MYITSLGSDFLESNAVSMETDERGLNSKLQEIPLDKTTVLLQQCGTGTMIKSKKSILFQKHAQTLDFSEGF